MSKCNNELPSFYLFGFEDKAATIAPRVYSVDRSVRHFQSTEKLAMGDIEMSPIGDSTKKDGTEDLHDYSSNYRLAEEPKVSWIVLDFA